MKPQNHFFRLKETKGAILIEVMIALLVFVIGLTGSLALLVHSATVNSINKNRIIANNLAREGLEVVKNIRDTNWLVSSANMRECWNFSPDTNEDGDMSNNAPCTPENGQNQHPFGTTGLSSTKERVRSFLVDFDPSTSRWMLLPAPDFLKTDATGFANYSVGTPNGEVTSIPLVGSRKTNLFITSDGRYSHLPSTTASPFYRVIEIYYIDNSGPGENQLYPDANKLSPTEAAWKDNRIKVISKIYWKNSDNEKTYKTLSLETILTDYLNRDNWSD